MTNHSFDNQMFQKRICAMAHSILRYLVAWLTRLYITPLRSSSKTAKS